MTYFTLVTVTGKKRLELLDVLDFRQGVRLMVSYYGIKIFTSVKTVFD